MYAKHKKRFSWLDKAKGNNNYIKLLFTMVFAAMLIFAICLITNAFADINAQNNEQTAEVSSKNTSANENTEFSFNNNLELNEKLSEDVYSITWETDGGSAVSGGSTEYTIETTGINLPNEPTKEHYEFVGWKAFAKEGSEIYGWPDDPFKAPPTLDKAYGNVVLTAIWTPHSYTITWDTTGGKGETKGASIDYTFESTSINLPSAPTKDHYEFAGWIASAKEGSVIKGWPLDAFTEQPTLDKAYGNVILSATWIPITYTIEWFVDGKIVTGGSTEYTIDSESVNLPNEPIKDHYEFAGWVASGKDGSTISGWPSRPFKESLTLDKAYGNVIITATWTPVKYTIRWDINKGSGDIGKGSIEYTIESIGINLPKEPTREHYEFAGWKASAEEGSVIKGWPLDAFTEPPTLDKAYGNVVLSATWNPAVYDIRWDTTGGSTVEGGSKHYIIESKTVTLPNSPTKTGYSFDGWLAMAEKGSEIYGWPKETFTESPTLNKAYGNVVIKAQWTPITYTIEWDVNGGAGDTSAGSTAYTIEATSIAIPTVEPTREYYTFGGWRAFAKGSSSISRWPEVPFTKPPTLDNAYGNVVLKAQWNPIDFTIKWEPNEGSKVSGGSETYTIESNSITLPSEPKKDYYTFVGWSASAAEGSIIYGWPETPFKTSPTLVKAHGNVVLTAHWKLTEYDISWDTKGGSIVEGGSKSYTIDSTSITLPSAPTKDHYNFSGWLASAKEGSSISGWPDKAFTTSPTLNNAYGDVVLTAQWTPVVYTIKWDPDGGNVVSGGSTTYTIEDTTITVPSEEPTKEHFTFGGWLAIPDGYTTISGWPNIPFKTAPELDNPNGNVILKAKWLSPDYKITWDTAGGSEVSGGSETYTIDSKTITLPNNPTKTGYTFGGWLASAKEGSSISGWPDKAFTTSPTLNNAYGDVVLTAQWTAIEYDITWDTAGGSKVSGGSSIYTIESTSITLTAEPTKTGYTFAGWLASGDKIYGWPDKAFTTSPTLNNAYGDVILTAQWTAIEYDITWDTAGGSEVSGGSSTYTIESTNITMTAKPSKTGHTFTGWLASGEEIYGWPEIAFSTSPTLNKAHGDVVLTAQWTAIDYDITWDTAGGSVVSGGSEIYTIDSTTITLPNNPTKTGYTFGGWLASAQEGSTITGWPETAFTTAPTLNKAYGNVVLTAQWTLIASYTIKWDTAGGSSVSGGSETYTTNDTSIVLPSVEPIKDNYIFGGWLASAAEGSVILGWPDTAFKTSPTLNKASGNVVLTAQWNLIPSYSIEWDTAGGSAVSGGSTIYTSNDSTISLPSDPTKTGYIFEGWLASAKEGSEISGWPEIAFKTAPTLNNASGNVVLTAQWTVKVFNIIYKDEGGNEFSGVHEQGYPTTHVYNTETLLKGATKDNYEFLGWHKKMDCTDAAVTTIHEKEISEDITLYAKWKKVEKKDPDPDIRPDKPIDNPSNNQTKTAAQTSDNNLVIVLLSMFVASVVAFITVCLNNKKKFCNRIKHF